MQLKLSSPPDNPEQLQAAIADNYPGLSNRLQQIARYSVDNPDDMAIETIAVIAERARVQPSAVIRFAKAFGYTGFSQMQRVFRRNLRERAPSYSERVRRFWENREDLTRPSPADVLREFASASRMTLEHLENTLDDTCLLQAIELLDGARLIHIMGQRRSFPVAAYLAYAVSHGEHPAQLLDGVGGMLDEQLRCLSREDVLIAVSFHPYAPETARVVNQAAAAQIPIVAITDSSLSPIAQRASLCFEIKDAEVRGFRSLTASLCLAQALAVSLALAD